MCIRDRCTPCFRCAAPRALHPKLQSRPHSCARCLHRDSAPHIRGRRLARRPSLYPVRPPCDSAGKLPLHRQQAAHPLRLGGHPRLCLRWIWLELGAGKLLLKPSPTKVCVWPRQSLWRLPVPHSPQHVRGDHTYTEVRAGRRKQTSSGCGCLTSARECRTSMCVLCG